MKSRVKKDADLLLRVGQEEKSRVKNDADLFLRVNQTRRVERRMTQGCCVK